MERDQKSELLLEETKANQQKWNCAGCGEEKTGYPIEVTHLSEIDAFCSLECVIAFSSGKIRSVRCEERARFGRFTAERTDRQKLLQELDELLEGVELFGWIDEDRDGPSFGEDREAPKRARAIVEELIASLAASDSPEGQ